MGKNCRRVIAVEQNSGEIVKFESAYSCAIELKTGFRNVQQALERNGICKGWKLYDSVEFIDAQIELLKERREESRRLEENL